MKFQDRVDAGKQLAQKLIAYQNAPNTIVLGLPRGGVITACEIARELGLPMDIKVVRKIGAPSNPELAIGALTASGTIYLNISLMESMGLTIDIITPTIEVEKKEALRRLKLYRGNRAPLEIKDKTVIIVDDGVATGATMYAAIKSVKLHGAKEIIIATPVASPEIVKELAQQVNTFICLYQPTDFWGISQFYGKFDQVSDDQVIDIMRV